MSTSMLRGNSTMFVPTIDHAEGAAAGIAIASFCPAVCRKIKAFFTRVDSDLKARVEALEAKIVADGTAALKTAETEVKKAV